MQKTRHQKSHATVPLTWSSFPKGFDESNIYILHLKIPNLTPNNNSKEEIKNLTEKIDSFSLNAKFIEEGTAVEEKARWTGSLVNKERSSLLSLETRLNYWNIFSW